MAGSCLVVKLLPGGFATNKAYVPSLLNQNLFGHLNDNVNQNNIGTRLILKT